MSATHSTAPTERTQRLTLIISPCPGIIPTRPFCPFFASTKTVRDRLHRLAEEEKGADLGRQLDLRRQWNTVNRHQFSSIQLVVCMCVPLHLVVASLEPEVTLEESIAIVD